MKSTNRTSRCLLLGCILTIALNCYAQPNPPGDGGTNGGSGGSWPLLNTNRNYIKFMSHAFSQLDTNVVVLTDTNLYDALAAFPDNNNTNPNIQVAFYGSDSLIVKANHFDYSGETDREFALLICDKAETPVWKSIDLSGASDSEDGWLVQGTVPGWRVADSMFFKVSNIARAVTRFSGRFLMPAHLFLSAVLNHTKSSAIRSHSTPRSAT